MRNPKDMLSQKLASDEWSEMFRLTNALDLADGMPVKFVCPNCGSDKLVVYYLAGMYETRAMCVECSIDDAVHTG